MNLIVVSLLAVYCFVSLAFGEDEPRRKLYRQVFEEYDPPMTRDETLKLVQELKELYQNNPWGERAAIVNELFRYSEVSEEACDTSVMPIMSPTNKFSGRANKLVATSRRMQMELCKNLWEPALVSAVNRLDPNDKETLSKIIKAMIKTNGGTDFQGPYCDMSRENAQAGVLTYLKQASGKRLSKTISPAEFNELFDKYIFKPCEKIVDPLKKLASKYIDILRFYGSATHLNPTAVEWTRKDRICEKLRGSGYSNKLGYSFRGDLFLNLTDKKEWNSLP